MLLTLMTTALAGGPAELITLHQTELGYGAALSSVVNDPDWSDVELDSLTTHSDWRVAHQARVVLAWRADGERAATHWTMPPMPSRADDLGRFPGGAEAWDMIFLDRLLHADEDARTRGALIEVCHRSEFSEAEAFYDLLVEEPDARVREGLVWSLQRTELGVEAIQLGLTDSDPTVRMVAARGAAHRTDGARLQADLVAALSDSAPEVRAGAARSLGVLSLAPTAGDLVPLLGDADAEVRLNALRALDRMGAAVPHAAGLVADADPKVQRLAQKIQAR